MPRTKLPEVMTRVQELCREYGFGCANVFHAGDGNLHTKLLFDRRDEEQVARVEAASKEIMAACVAAGGTITGEHGVGVDKRKYMRLVYGDVELEAMRGAKAVFDPTGLMNPGKVLPDSAPEEEGA